jgi:hypothetical protein
MCKTLADVVARPAVISLLEGHRAMAAGAERESEAAGPKSRLGLPN